MMLLSLILMTFFSAGETATTKEPLSHGRGAAGNACGDANAVGDCRAPLQCLAGGGQVTLSYTCPSTLLVCCTFTSGCGGSSRGRVSEWRNPSYPKTDFDLPDLCTYSITPAVDTCYIRAEFTELTAPSSLSDSCQDNILTIFNQKEGSGSSLCGAFTGYTTFIRVQPSWLWFTNPVQFSLRIRTTPYKFSVKFTQLRCADVKSFSVSSRSRRDALFNVDPLVGYGRSKPGPNFKPSKSELLAYKLAAEQALLSSKTTMATLSYPATTIGLGNNLENLAQDLALSLGQQNGFTGGIYDTGTPTDFTNNLDGTNIFHTLQPGFTSLSSSSHLPGSTASGFSTTDPSLMTLSDMNLGNTMSLFPINSQANINSIIPNDYPSSFPSTELLQNTDPFYQFPTSVSAGLNVINSLGANSMSLLNQNDLLHSNIQNTLYPQSTSSSSLDLLGVTTGSSHPFDVSTSSTVSPTGGHSTLTPLATVTDPSNLSRPGSTSVLGSLNSFGNYDRPGNFNKPINLNRPGILFRPNGRFNFSSNLEKLTASYLSENAAVSASNFPSNSVLDDNDFNLIPGINGQNINPTKNKNDFFSTFGTVSKFPERGTSGSNNNYLTSLGDFSQHSLQLLNMLASTTVSPQIPISLSGSPIKHSDVTQSLNKSTYFPFTTPSSTTLSPNNIMRPTLITVPLREKGGQKISSQTTGDTGLTFPQTSSTVFSDGDNNYFTAVTESATTSLQPPGNMGVTFPLRGNDGLGNPPGTFGMNLPMSGNSGITLSTLGDLGMTDTPFITNGGIGTSTSRPSISGISNNDPLDTALNSIVNNLNIVTTTASPASSFTTVTSSARPTRPYRPTNPSRLSTSTTSRPPTRRPILPLRRPPLRSPTGGDWADGQSLVSHRQPISNIFQSFLNGQSEVINKQSSSYPVTRLAGGSPALPDSFLFMGMSVLKTKDGNYHGCGAALISANYALTAARCYLRKGLSDRYEVRVIFGPDRSILDDNPPLERIYSHTMSRKVAKVIFHPMVDHTTLRYDLAVLRVSQPYRNVPSATLPTPEAEFSGTGATIVSWGLSEVTQPTNAQQGTNAELQTLDAVVLSNADCNNAWTGIRNSYHFTGSTPVIYNEMVCTKAAASSAGVCAGDEGGALIKKGVNGEDILVGIVSGAHHNCGQSADGSRVETVSNFPDITTRVSAFLDWIDAVTTEYRYPCGVDFYTFTYRECIL